MSSWRTEPIRPALRRFGLPRRPAFAEGALGGVDAVARLALGLRVLRAEGEADVAAGAHQLGDEALSHVFRKVRVGRAPAAAVDDEVAAVGRPLDGFARLHE